MTIREGAQTEGDPETYSACSCGDAKCREMIEQLQGELSTLKAIIIGCSSAFAAFEGLVGMVRDERFNEGYPSMPDT